MLRYVNLWVKSCFWPWSKNLTVFKKYWTYSKKFEGGKNNFWSNRWNRHTWLGHQAGQLSEKNDSLTVQYDDVHEQGQKFFQSVCLLIMASNLRLVDKKRLQFFKIVHLKQMSANCPTIFLELVLTMLCISMTWAPVLLLLRLPLKGGVNLIATMALLELKSSVRQSSM